MRGSSSLTFLINSDLPFLCDSATLWLISPFSATCEEQEGKSNGI